MKTDLYSFVHKAQRVQLFDLAAAIGRADFSDAEETARIVESFHHMIQHLREHAAIEASYIHPLYQEVDPTSAQWFDREHGRLEEELEALEKIVADKEWGRLYRAYNLFLGRYLMHIEEEETAQDEVLWKRVEDDKLMEVFARFQRERAPEKLRSDLELFLPALNAVELTRIFTGMKLKAPDYVFAFAQGLGEQMTKPEIWNKVKAAIAN